MQNIYTVPTLTEEQFRKTLRRARRVALLKSGFAYICAGLSMAIGGVFLSALMSRVSSHTTVIYVGLIFVGLINVVIGIFRFLKCLVV